MIYTLSRTAFTLIALFLVAGCLPVGISSPFTQKPTERQAFVQSVEIGKTNVSNLISRWGKPTAIDTAETGQNPDQVYSWSSSTLSAGGGGYVTVRANHLGVVETVVSANGAGVSDNFTAGKNAQATPSPRVVAASTTPLVASSGQLTPEIGRAMLAYTRRGDATPQGFLQRFGQPVLREKTSSGLFTPPEETWTYGTVPISGRYCKEAPFVWVTVYPNSNDIDTPSSNILGGC